MFRNETNKPIYFLQNIEGVVAVVIEGVRYKKIARKEI